MKEESYKSQRAFLLVGWWLLLVGWLLLLLFRAFSSSCTSLQWNHPLNLSFTLSYYLSNISVYYSTPPSTSSLMLSTYEIYPSKLEKSDAIIFTDIFSFSERLDLDTKKSHYAPPPAKGMGSNKFNTISWYHVYWNHLFLSIWSTINWYSPSWRNGKATCRMLSTPRWANASSLPPGTFFSILFSIFRFFIFSHFSLLQEVERWREKQRRRGQKAFKDSLIFLTLRIPKKKSQRIYFLVLAYS